MTQTNEKALREVLNQVDRERRRATGMYYALLLLTFSFWAAMILAKDDHAGLPYGLAAVIASVFVAGMMASRASSHNTRTILKAIEQLAEQNQNG